jgi:uncharacterized protein
MIGVKNMIFIERLEQENSPTSLQTIIYQRLGINQNEIIKFCEKWQIAEFALFGSVLRDDFSQNSDIDVLITYLPAAKRGLLEKITMKEELEKLFNRSVDILSKTAIEKSYNWLRKKHIIDSAQVIYAS